MKKIIRVFVVVVFCFNILLASQPITAFALSAEQKKTFDSGVRYFNVDDDCNLAGSATASGGINSDGTIWNSGLSAPFIVEQFAIEILKDLAQKKGVSQDDTVTQEHVVALVTFAWGEGGDINSPQEFNLMNTGYNAPELLDGPARSDGVQSYKSFDAGVEAMTRTIVGSNQSRLGDVLSRKDSNAEDFFVTLSDWRPFPGNYPYAGASVIGGYNKDGTPDPGYLSKYLQLLGQIRSDYVNSAGTVIGTPEQEADTGLRQTDLVKFGGGNGSATKGVGAECGATPGNGIVANNIAQTAVNLSWSEAGHGLDPKPEYAAAVKQFNPGAAFDGADCGSFVGTVMHASNADPDYPAKGTSAQEAYVRAHPEKYDIIESAASTADLKPGDILIANVGDGQGGNGHTWIYVGSQPPNGYDRADASMNSRMPQLGKAILTYQGKNFMIARLKG